MFDTANAEAGDDTFVGKPDDVGAGDDTEEHHEQLRQTGRERRHDLVDIARPTRCAANEKAANQAGETIEQHGQAEDCENRDCLARRAQPALADSKLAG